MSLPCPGCTSGCAGSRGLTQHFRLSERCPLARHLRLHGGSPDDYIRQLEQSRSRSNTVAAAGQGPPRTTHLQTQEEIDEEEAVEATVEEGIYDIIDFPPFDFGGEHYPEDADPSLPDSGDEGAEVGPDDDPAILEDLLQKHEEYLAANPAGLPLTSVFLVQTSLFRLLKSCNAPLKMFDEVLAWAHESSLLAGFSFKEKKLPGRDAYTTGLFSRFNLAGIAPIKEKVVLPDTKATVELVTHDVKSLLLSILTCPRIMHDDNFLFTDDNPMAPPPARPKVIDDVNTGSRYREAHKVLCTDPTCHVLFPVMAFVDKTHLDEHGNLCLEPVSLCPLWVKRSVRNQPWAWRTIGYLPNQATHSHTSPTGKCRDLHFMLAHILKSFIEIQNSGGVRWKLEYKGVTYDVVLKFTLFFVMGDTEGHNKLAARYLNNSNIQQFCRYCDCPAASTDNPFYDFTYRIQKRVQALVAKGDVETLRAISQQPVASALYQLAFPGCPRGIYGALPAEWLHMMQKGLFERVVTCFFGLKKLRKAKAKKANAMEKKRKLGTKTVYEPAGDNLISHKVFSIMMLDWVDKEAKVVGRQLRQQSERNWPRSFFPQGLSTAKKLAAHEQSGVLLLLLVLLCSTLSSDKLIETQGMSTSRIGAYIEVIEGLLFWEQWAKRKDGFERKKLKYVEAYIPRFLEMVKRVLHRVEGKGMAIIKFHLPLHMIDDLKRFGSPLNVDSGIGEHNHIANVKEPARRTQRRVDSLEFQTATRLSENIVHGRATAEYDRFCGVPPVLTAPVLTAAKVSPKWMAGGTTYFLDGTRCLQLVESKRVDVCRATAELPWIQYMQEHVVPLLTRDDQGFIKIRTEAKLGDDHLVRAHPSFRSRGSWYDWYNVDWGGHGIIPAHVRLFVVVQEPLTAIMGSLPAEFSTIDSVPGIYALIESIEQPLDSVPPGCPGGNYLLNQSSRVVYWGRKWWGPTPETRSGPMLSLVNLDSFESPCTAIPDPQTEDERASRDDIDHYIFLVPRDDWCSIFDEEAEYQFYKGNDESEEEEDGEDYWDHNSEQGDTVDEEEGGDDEEEGSDDDNDGDECIQEDDDLSEDGTLGDDDGWEGVL